MKGRVRRRSSHATRIRAVFDERVLVEITRDSSSLYVLRVALISTNYGETGVDLRAWFARGASRAPSPKGVTLRQSEIAPVIRALRLAAARLRIKIDEDGSRRRR